MMNILQSLLSLIQSQIHQPVVNFQHRLNEMYGSLLSIEKSLSQLKVRLINSIAIKLQVKKTRSILVYAEKRATSPILVSTGPNDPTVHLTQCFWMAVVLPMFVANNN